MKEKCGIPRDQQIRELLSVYHTMTQQPNESVADFAHRFSGTQHELDKLIPGIHKTASKDIELIFAFVNKLRSEISKELVPENSNLTNCKKLSRQLNAMNTM